MKKTVAFNPKKSTPVPTAQMDAWINEGGAGKGGEAIAPEKTKRFTFDVPEALHRRVKARCAEMGVDMADEMRRLLEQHFTGS